MKEKLGLHPFIFILTYFLFLSPGCSKSSSDECEGLVPPTITFSETVLAAGEPLELHASSVEGAEYYLWTGPDGFSSDEQNPVIEHAQPSQSGVFKVQVGVTGGCVVNAASDSVSINLPAAACNPENNTAHIDGVSGIQIYSATGGASGGSYFLTANGISGDIELEFPGTDKPTAGVYSVRKLTDQFVQGDVRLKLVAQSSNWPASEGKVHIDVINGKIVAIFCSVPVTGQTVTFATTATGKITED